MESEGIVRPCILSDASVAADLILLSMGTLGEYLWGSGDAGRARRVLGALFAGCTNRFSHEFGVAVETAAGPVGLGLGYPAERMGGLQIPTAWQLVRTLGAREFARFLKRTRPLVGAKEAEKGEFFICVVAVQPAMQGTGVGRRLMAGLEEAARRHRRSLCSLCVEVENEKAQRFYSRLGYRIVETLRFASLRARIGYEGYHRMVKRFPTLAAREEGVGVF